MVDENTNQPDNDDSEFMNTKPQNKKTKKPGANLPKQGFIKPFIIIIILLFIVFIRRIATMYTDYLWFSSQGFSNIFTTILSSQIGLFFLSAIIFFVFVFLNLFIATKFQKSNIPLKIGAAVAGVLSIIVGLASARSWLTALEYLNRVNFNIADPIFGKDVAFYVFSLPFFMVLWKFVFFLIVITLIVVAISYFQKILTSKFSQRVDPNTNTVYKSVNLMQEFSKVKKLAMIHVAILGSLVFVLLSIKHYLDIFSVMYSESGIVVGAGYTDVMVFLPAVKLLIVVALITAVLFFVWIFLFSTAKQIKKRHLIVFVIIIYVAFVILGKSIIPGIVQSLVVSPNEINLETPFIQNNIKFTKIAYGLDKVTETDFAVVQNITPQTLANAKETIDNARILDWRPLTKTYKQTQEIRLYYDLSEVDIDRYTINGKYTQVMLAPRELDQRQITPNAQTWVNLHMIYTHGFGTVISPVNKVTKQGLPLYLVKDIPPTYTVNETSLKIDEPRIYYGERDNDYVLVNTKTKEFDYPKGSKNEYIQYDGKGGVLLDTLVKKIGMALRFFDIKILLSSDMTPKSKIMFTRSIQKRISKITPFLMLDSDPYLVIDNGRQYWIQDAYTTTGNFPYSQKYYNINYMRNSVKIVMDAYDGTISYYVIDTNDPLIQVFAKIFPGEFKQFKDMPLNLKKHVRYPEDLFKIQSMIYSTYHMNDPTVFYNKEDAWQIPKEIYGTGQKITVEPYYMIMKLPGETKEEFVLMTTFTPIKKDNMIAWMAARIDGNEYGKLLLYKFPKDKLIYGPLQIEAKIDQDSEISQQLTLWSQQGSSVTRGNLLVIPIENSLLYIEPLYIQADQGQLPELKRVLVSDGESVVMEKDLATGLEKLFGKSLKKKTFGSSDHKYNATASNSDLSKKANKYYSAILTSMQKGDWSEFGDNFDNLGKVLKELE